MNRTTACCLAGLFSLGVAVMCRAQGSNIPSGSNSVWLSLSTPTNGTATVVVHSTEANQIYELLSKPDFSSGPNWISQGFLAGAAGQTTTNVTVSSNQQYYSVRSFPVPGQLLVTHADDTSFSAYINGQSNWLTPFFNNSVLVGPPLYSFNVGYDASDDGSAGIPLLPPQNVVAISGLSPAMTTLTNLCASYNPITTLNVSGLPALQDLECYNCTRLTSVQLTNCPNLTRACIEQCSLGGTLDFTGDTNLADIRGAANRFTNIIFGGAGPKVWHLCLRDNPQLQFQVPMTNFPEVQILFLWNANQSGALVPTSHKLAIAQVEENAYTSADFSNQTNLFLILIMRNSLTNLVIDGSPWIRDLQADHNLLSQPVLDTLLGNLDSAGLTNGYVNLSSNADVPSYLGVMSAKRLQEKGWTVVLGIPGF